MVTRSGLKWVLENSGFFLSNEHKKSHDQNRVISDNAIFSRGVAMFYFIFLSLFSCEEAALEVQMLLCLFDCVSPKLNFTFCLSIVNEVYTKPVYCTSVHKTSLLYSKPW